MFHPRRARWRRTEQAPVTYFAVVAVEFMVAGRIFANVRNARGAVAAMHDAMLARALRASTTADPMLAEALGGADAAVGASALVMACNRRRTINAILTVVPMITPKFWMAVDALFAPTSVLTDYTR